MKFSQHSERKSFRKWALNTPAPKYNRKFARSVWAAMKKAK